MKGAQVQVVKIKGWGACEPGATIAAGGRMASLPQRKRRRRRKIRCGKPAEELVNTEKKSANIERLAHKYMQKCSLESSTESESDANTEVLSISMITEGSLERKSSTQLQFMDPYDGDYEEISGNSDCGLDFSDLGLVYLSHSITDAQTREDSTPPEEVILSTPPPRVVTPKNEQLQNTEQSWCTGPSAEIAASEDVLQPMLIDQDYQLYKDLNVNRKRQSALECAEKLRKRLCLT